MIVTSKVNIDLLRSGETPVVEVVQDDRYSRNLELSLFAGDDAWPVPQEADVLIRYHKPDETGGEYNLLPDGTQAYSAEGNILTVALAPQVLTTPGDVILTVVLTLDQKQISTSRIVIRVNRGLTVENTYSESYYNVALETIKAVLGFVPVDRDRISIGLNTSGLLHLFIDGNPVGLGVALEEQADDAVHYTIQSLTDAQKKQARKNISAVSEGEVEEAIAQTIAEAISDKTQIEPNFANSIEECTDTSKVYVLPDGYIYGYMYTTSEPPKITTEEATGGYWDGNNQWSELSGYRGSRTNLIPVTEGDQFAYEGVADWNVYSVVWYDESQNILSRSQQPTSPPPTTTYTAPTGAKFVRFYSIGYGGVPLVLKVSWILWQSVVTGYQWKSTGHAFIPTDYEDRILDLEATSADNTTAIEKLTDQMDSVKEALRNNGQVEITIESMENGYWNMRNGWFDDPSCSSKRTNLIPVSQGDQFVYTGLGIYNTASVIWYDDREGFLAAEQYNNGNGGITTVTVTVPSGAAYVRFFSFNYGEPDKVVLAVTYVSEDSKIEELKAGNFLYGKKYVACGDSFTAGDFTGIGKTSETWSDEFQTYKTYPYWIASRNRMTLVNEAICGTTMHNNGSENAFSVTRYTEIPKDADYITLCFGLNETSAPIGTLEDTTNSTVMGAWNIVLEYLITNMPYAKIGIIIPDAWCTEAMRSALISVAKYWGIPWLDTKGDPKVSLMMGGRYSDVTLNPKAAQLRNAAFYVSDTNTHPNVKAHEYRSTVIENFLRSL